jgi:hypothetical protein
MEPAEVLIRAEEGNFVRYRVDDMAEVVNGSDSRLLPRRFVATFPDDAGGPELHLRFEVRDGIPQCREVLLTSPPDGREIRPVDIRSIDVERLLEIACALITLHVTAWAGDGLIAEHSHRDPDLDAATREVRWSRRNTRRALADSRLPEVAEVYRNNPDAPTAAVERHFKLKSRRTASLYVRRARDAGLLEERDGQR